MAHAARSIKLWFILEYAAANIYGIAIITDNLFQIIDSTAHLWLLRRRTRALAITPTSTLGARWKYSWATAITTCRENRGSCKSPPVIQSHNIKYSKTLHVLYCPSGCSTLCSPLKFIHYQNNNPLPPLPYAAVCCSADGSILPMCWICMKDVNQIVFFYSSQLKVRKLKCI